MVEARQLLQLKRYPDAEQRLREALTSEPEDFLAHRLLALALYHQEREGEALPEAERAISLAPDDPNNHYVLAAILLAMDRPQQARQSAQEALRLDPNIPAYHALLARIYVKQKQWQRAREAAESGLRLAPEHVECINVRAMALVGLGEREQASELIETALAQEPEEALSHANMGWTLLHRNQPEKAMEHFREALRLDPMSQWARAGIIEALKARNPLYRLILRYFLWMSRLTKSERWTTIFVSSGVMRGLRVLARQIPLLWIVVLPLVLFYQLFVFLTWVARPLFGFFLLFDPFGRLALPEEERVAAKWVGGALVASGVSFVLFLLLVVPGFLLELPLLGFGFLVLAVAAFAFMMPLAGIFVVPEGVRRTFLAVYAGLLGALGVATAVLTALGTPWSAGIALLLGLAFIVGWSLFAWISNLLLVIK
jgi:Tfp pilus assembly protein PilF